jgi:hypothetical protein
MTVAAGLGIAALAGLAFVLSYDDLRALALAGGAARDYAPFYPIMADALVVVTILSLAVARRTHWWARGVRWLLLLVLLAGAAAASTQRALNGYDPLPDRTLSAGVAIAPWALLLIAVWLWLSMFRQARAASATRTASPETAAPPPEPPAAEPRTAEPRAEQIIPGFAALERTEADAGTGVPATLPTDIRLVTRPAAAPSETTQPDIAVPPRGTADETADATEAGDAGNARADADEDDDVERWSALAAEDAERWAEEAADTFGAEGGEDDDARTPKQSPAMEWIPPSSTFRSSPTPPRE